MADELAEPPAVAQPVGTPPRRRPLKELWRKIRGPIARSRFFKSAVARSVAGSLRAIHRSNRLAHGSIPFKTGVAGLEPVIIALWHGQHLLTPCFYPRGQRLVAMFSRSADAELNALVFERLGFSTVRGSGGREGDHRSEKGGARALIGLKRVLDAGDNVAMIADIPHGTPREAGLGIVVLARISGRPIVPIATATSRRKVLEKSWDKTTINLPFGRSSIVVGDPVWVPADASEADLEGKRLEVTRALNAVTERAYGLVDGGA
jgi:lysophospholipid acyltransferase (LPLAT)-like uncharacterized protein